jgi:hypothetical protein
MEAIAVKDWDIDLAAMTCRNIRNNIIVSFERAGNIFLGKIKDIPNNLIEKWATEPDGKKKANNMVMEAEDIFIKVYLEYYIMKMNE